MDCQIRPIEPSDAPTVAELSEELGYPAEVTTMEERIRTSIASPDRATFVACSDRTVVGWIDISLTHHLQSGTAAEIGGLVVSGACRGAGIGAALVQHAEKWAKARGMTRIIVRSRITRERAHRFYLRGGYEQTKTSAVFTKNLLPPE